MENQAVKFWIETPLTNVAKLVADYREYAQDGGDLSDMYNEDADDFHKAISLFRQSDAETLSQHVQFMDTSPRDSLVMAFFRDCGKDFVEHVLGYSIRNV
jgi:hypothetical protein